MHIQVTRVAGDVTGDVLCAFSCWMRKTQMHSTNSATKTLNAALAHSAGSIIIDYSTISVIDSRDGQRCRVSTTIIIIWAEEWV